MSNPYPKLTTQQFIDSVGNTELIKVESISKEIGRNVYFKAEYTNPGKSIKDRAAVYLIQDALKSGQITPGGTFVEATAGNTGIAVTLLAKSYDPPFNVVLYVPETLVEEKINILESIGAKVVKSPIVPQDDPEYVNNRAIRFAKENPNSVHVNQMDNLSNRRAHYETTGPEIWKQTNGKIDAFISAAGTGGTFTGVSSFLKDVSDGRVETYLADREGSGLYSFITSKGDNWDVEGESFIEGIGKVGLTGQLHDALKLADGAVRILDTDAILTIYNLIDKEGLYVGASGGLNIAAARELAKSLPPGSTVVTTVADTSERYASKLFNKEYLVEKNHWDSIPEELRKYANY